LRAADEAIDDLHKARAIEDDADTLPDYRALLTNRNTCIATLIKTRSVSSVGTQAKASALQLPRMIEDYAQHQQIAVSLADDLAGRRAGPSSPNAHPDEDLVALGEKFEPLLASYFEERMQWAEGAIKARARVDEKYPDGPHSAKSPAHQMLCRELRKTGATAADKRGSKIIHRMYPIAEKIEERPARSTRGLRAKTLVAIWRALPATAPGKHFSVDGEDLLYAAADVCGLTPMINAMTDRLWKVGETTV
jgi:hypothetical protein